MPNDIMYKTEKPKKTKLSDKLTIMGENLKNKFKGNHPDYEYRILNDGTAEITYYNGNESAITIPSEIDNIQVTRIGVSAFYGCTSLESVTIGNGVTSIGDDAFYNTAWYNNQPDGLVYAGKVAYAYKGEMPENTEIVLQDGTSGISDSAFSYCTGLTSITIPDSVTSIGSYAFRGCTGLKEINVSENNQQYSSVDGAVLSKDKSELILCPQGKKEYTIPDSVTTISDSAFSGCTSLKSITIPDSVTSIGHGAFYNTAWYNNQPDGLVYAGKVAYAYKGKMPKNTEIVLQDGTLSITDDAFYYRTGLTSITIPDSVTSIGDSAFSGCTSLESITIPDGVTYIGESAFFRCTSLESVAIGNGVTKIDDYAFEDCTSLTSVTIPDSVTSIGVYAFKGCTSLESVTIPKNITSISVGAFEKYTKIKRIATPDTPNKILSDKNLKEMEYRRDTDCDGIPDRIDPTKRYKDDESLEYNRDTDCDGLPDRIDSNDNDEKYQFKKVDNETFEKLSQSDIPIESMIKDDSILIKYQASDSEKVDNLLSSVGQKLAR